MKQVDFKGVEVSGTEFDGLDAGIDHNNLGFIFDIVSKQMYRKPISSIVREITSNCFDSHVEAGVDAAAVVEMGSDDGGDFISFTDYGIGISPERMKDTYAVYFKSSKRDTNGQIGFFGLGSKSPLAYTDCFYLSTVYNFQKYDYIIYRGEKCPRIELIMQEESTAHNGTEVKIYIEDYNDQNKFHEACLEQLLYFDNVFFKGTSINNAYKIVEGDNFKWREDCPIAYLHICLGKVMYPIDFEQLGIQPIKIPLALKFEIGDLCVTPERESLRYIKFKKEDDTWVDTSEIILEKINLLRQELNERMQQQVTDCYDLGEFLLNRGTTSFSLKLDDSENKLQIHRNNFDGLVIPEAKFVPLQDYPIKFPTRAFMYLIETDARLFNGGTNVKPSPYERITLDDRDIIGGEHFLVRVSQSVSEKQDRKKMLWYKELAQGRHIIFIKKRNYDSKRGLYSRVNDVVPKHSKQVDYEKYNKLTCYQKFREELYKILVTKSISYSQEIDPEWLKRYKEEQKARISKRVKVVEEIVVQDYSEPQKTYRKKYIKPKEEFAHFTGFLLYGFKEDILRLEYMASSLFGGINSPYSNNKACRIYEIAKTHEKHFILMKNAVHVQSFMTNANKVLNKLATAIVLAKSYSSKLSDVAFSRKSDGYSTFNEQFKTINPIIIEKKIQAEEYMNMFYSVRMGFDRSKEDVAGLEQEIVDVVSAAGGINQAILDEASQVTEYFKDLSLLKHVVYSKQALPLIAEYVQLKGKPVDCVWDKPNESEKEFVKESYEKATYLVNLRDSIRDYALKATFDKRVNYQKVVSNLEDITPLYNHYYGSN